MLENEADNEIIGEINKDLEKNQEKQEKILLQINKLIEEENVSEDDKINIIILEVRAGAGGAGADGCGADAYRRCRAAAAQPRVAACRVPNPARPRWAVAGVH